MLFCWLIKSFWVSSFTLLCTDFKSLEDAKEHRIAIAGDIILTYKEKAAKPLGLQPKRNWRTFTCTDSE